MAILVKFWCKGHPTYKGKKRPQVPCEACKQIWLAGKAGTRQETPFSDGTKIISVDQETVKPKAKAKAAKAKK